MGRVLLEAGSGADDSVLLAVVVSLLSIDGALIHQSVVVTLNGVFHDGSKGERLIGALAVMLDFRDQFHRVLTEADAELLRSIGMVVCHFCWGEWFDSGGGFRQQQQEQGSALREPLWVSWKRVGGANCFEFLAPQH